MTNIFSKIIRRIRRAIACRRLYGKKSGEPLSQKEIDALLVIINSPPSGTKTGRWPFGKKRTRPLTQEEIDMLLAATGPIPSDIALPPGGKRAEILSQKEIDMLLDAINS